MKKKYICPEIESIELVTEGAMMQASGVNNDFGSGREDDKKMKQEQVQTLALLLIPKTTTICGATAITFGNDSRNNRHKTAV